MVLQLALQLMLQLALQLVLQLALQLVLQLALQLVLQLALRNWHYNCNCTTTSLIERCGSTFQWLDCSEGGVAHNLLEYCAHLTIDNATPLSPNHRHKATPKHCNL
jgi:hypothetical protein